MISKKSINNNFHFFTSSTLQHAYYGMNEIQGLTVHSNTIIARLHYSPFNPTLHIKDDKITRMYCDCDESNYCTHLASLLLYLKSNIEILDHLTPGTTMAIGANDDLDESDDDEEEIPPFIRSGNVNSYRKILDVEAFLEYADGHINEWWGDDDYDPTIEIYSDRNNMLNVLLKDDPEYSYEDEVLIQFKWINEELYIKCHGCNHFSDNLCEHQEEILSMTEFSWVEHFINRNLNQEDQYKVFAEKNHFSTNLLKKHYDIGYVNQNQMHLRPKSDVLMITDKIIEFFEEDIASHNNEPDERDHLLSSLYEEDEKDTGNAIVWTRSYTNKLLIKYVQGRLASNNKKLTAFIEEIEEPKEIPFSVQRQMHRFHNVRADLREKRDALLMQQHLEFLQDNAYQWKDFIQYLYTDYYENQSKIKKSDLHLFQFAKSPISLDIHLSLEKEAFFIQLKINKSSGNKNERLFLFRYPLFYIIGDIAYVYQNISVLSFIEEFGEEKNFMFPPDKRELVGRFMSGMINKYQIEISSLDKKYYKTIPVSRRIIRISQHKKRIHLTPVVEGIGKEKFNVLTERTLPKVSKSHYLIIPEQEKVKIFYDWFKKLHPDIDSLTGLLGFYTLPLHAFSKDLWFLDFKEKCEKDDVHLEGWDTLEGFSFNMNRAKIIQQINADMDWFDIHFTIQYGDIIVPQNDWIKAIKKGEKHVLLEDGSYGVIPEEWRLKMTRLLNMAIINKDNIQLSKLQFNAVDQYVDLKEAPEIQENINELKSRLLHFEGVQSFEIPNTIQASLRPYQKEGFYWLKFLNEYGFGGCLADDMGLGKTLQVINLLADQKLQQPFTSLVVVPRSLIHNWAAEIEKFCPDLTYVIHHGSQRTKENKDFSVFDLVISTYGTVTQDIDILKSFRFHYVILDESQAIKNSASKRYKTIIQLNSARRLTLTGTPIENSTMDLYAQFNFINPGLVGNKTQFRKQFSDPIDKEGDVDAKKLLQKIIHPFLLRRTKDQVAQDLPPRTESILYCEMEGAQKDLYHKMKNEIRASLLDQENLEQNKIMVLDGLLKLRQICNSPALLKGKNQPQEIGNYPSIKIDTLMEQIEEVVVQENHSILVFSQFTSMLALVREQLDKKKIDYAYLDGSTTKRQVVIDEFNADDEKKIFLISLKAGNTGLNLTKADFVYLLDPWWNPAVESQAIDRTHRIGQTKPVFAYRFICKDTIEEKILRLQSQKTKIAEDLIKTDENVFKSLDKEALISLFD